VRVEMLCLDARGGAAETKATLARAENMTVNLQFIILNEKDTSRFWKV
jgi:hypothetical protein